MSNRRKVKKKDDDPDYWKAGLHPVVVKLRSGKLHEVDLSACDQDGWLCAVCGAVSAHGADGCVHAASPEPEGYCVARVAAAAALGKPGAVLVT